MQQESNPTPDLPVGPGANDSRRRRLKERGVAAVETALMVPLLFFLFFGMLEFGLYWMADHTVNESARAGARLGATLARELNYEDDVVATVENSIRGSVPSGQIENLTIFRADPATGDPISGTVLDCTTDCYRFTWNTSTDAFDPVDGPEWPSGDQAACGVIDHNDYMGVYVQVRYDSVSGIFPASRTVSESSIIRLEPVPLSNICEPSS